MRLSEKTIELTFCHQVASVWGNGLIWFGLTQRQERRAGFDAAVRSGGTLRLIQFKASAKTMRRTGARRFELPHDQLVALRDRVRARRLVYYAFPLVGTTAELAIHPNIVPHTWLMDVSQLPRPFPQPTKRDGSQRKSRIHYADVTPGRVRIHSDPIDVGAMSPSSIAQSQVGVETDSPSFNEYETFDAVASQMGRFSSACIVPP